MNTGETVRDIEVPFGRPHSRLNADVCANAAGFAAIAGLHADLSRYREADIVVDFSRVSWVDGHLTASLDVVFRQAALRGNVVRLAGLKPRLRDTFCRNRLICERKADRFNTVMPIEAFEPDEALAFSGYAKRHLDRPEMPNMAAALRSGFFEGIDELFANAALHARTVVPIVVGGQYFPRRRLLAFSLADGGRGIPAAVCARLGRHLRAAEAVDWAMEPFNTTRQGDVPGGLGSKILREFVETNGGRLTVVSNDGFWQQHGTEVCRRSLAAPYPGTAVVLEINTAAAYIPTHRAVPAPCEIW